MQIRIKHEDNADGIHNDAKIEEEYLGNSLQDVIEIRNVK